MKILVADDDPDMLDMASYALRREGFNIIVAADGAQALKRWQMDNPDLVLLDIKMPRVNGFDVCRQIRQASDTPVIMLTAVSDEEHVIQGFRGGADDYVIKPFSPKQLAARIRAVLRRASRTEANRPVEGPRVGKYVLDVEAHQLQNGSTTIHLTPREFRILFMLSTNEGRVVSFERLIEYTWGYGQGGSAILKTHISHLRSKLGLQRGTPGYIRVVNGAGYILEGSSSN